MLRKHNQPAQSAAVDQPLDLRRLNQAVFARAPKTVVLSYLVGEEETLLLALSAGATAGSEAALLVAGVPLKRAELARQVRDFQEGCLAQSSEIGASARSLYQLLIAPAQQALTGKDRLIIIPDGLLHGLPFQALQYARDKYLIERYEISYAPSATALVLMTEAASQRKGAPQSASGQAERPILIVGSPEFPPDFQLKELPFAAQEAEWLAEQYKTSALLGKAATETQVKAGIARAGRLHFATHGLVNWEAPLYSALAFARSETDDGMLYASELAEMQLQADLAVLSACQTAQGRETQGEGVLGLAWALFAAGVPSTLVTQWPVADRSSVELMKEFYRALALRGAAGTADKAAALRQAQLKLLHGPARHPYHWAPFILVGSPQ